MTMHVDAATSQKLLVAVRRATARSERLRARALDRYKRDLARANEPRRQAVIAAFEAQIPRKDIAAAAKISTARLYQVMDGTDTLKL